MIIDKTKNNQKPLILISNDDGYQSKGITSLIDMVRGIGDIVVCAPDSARSGYSRAFTAALPLRLHHQGTKGNVDIWSCDGTPVDCIKLAVDEILAHRTPDLIISGINHGDNASVNSHYSGTMGVVIEGCMKGIPSIAFSLADHREDADFEPMRNKVVEIINHLLIEGLPNGVCLNVNFPKTKEFAGVKICRMARGAWENECVKRQHPFGSEYFWLGGEYVSYEPEAEDTDRWALMHNYIAVTPTTIDLTAYEAIERMKSWDL